MSSPLEPRPIRDMADLLSREQRYGRSPSTHFTYEARWYAFESWCKREGHAALPADAETVQLYVTWAVITRGNSVKTVRLTLAAIADHHRHQGHPSPVTAQVKQHLDRCVQSLGGE